MQNLVFIQYQRNTDTSTSSFYLAKQLIHFHVGWEQYFCLPEWKNSRLCSTFSLPWSAIPSVVSRTWVSLTAALIHVTARHQSRAGEEQNFQHKMWREWWFKRHVTNTGPSWWLLNTEQELKPKCYLLQHQSWCQYRCYHYLDQTAHPCSEYNRWESTKNQISRSF